MRPAPRHFKITETPNYSDQKEKIKFKLEQYALFSVVFSKFIFVLIV
jgi:hypothetical protein